MQHGQRHNMARQEYLSDYFQIAVRSSSQHMGHVHRAKLPAKDGASGGQSETLKLMQAWPCHREETSTQAIF